MSAREAITVAMTGASGAQYGLRLLECLLDAGNEVFLLVSKPAQVVLAMETDLKLPGAPQEMETVLARHFAARPGQLQVLGREQWQAPIASGSGISRAMVICPCTSATLAAVATGASRDLLERAADVTLKEQRKLILVHREMPVSAIHLEHMLTLARLGAVIMPASPGFYHRPQDVAGLVDFVVARILDHLDIEHQLLPRWGNDGGERG